MSFLFFYWGAISAALRRFSVRLFGAFSMQVATTTPQTLKRFLAAGPDMAKILAVVALPKAILSSVWLYLNINVVKAVLAWICLEILRFSLM
jgi:hypothetical protein